MYVCDYHSYSFLMIPLPPTSTLFPYTTLFRSLSTSMRLTRLRARQTTRPSRVTSRVKESSKRSSRSSKARLPRSEEHTSELQSHVNLVCRLLLEKKKYQYQHTNQLHKQH